MISMRYTRRLERKCTLARLTEPLLVQVTAAKVLFAWLICSALYPRGALRESVPLNVLIISPGCMTFPSV